MEKALKSLRVTGARIVVERQDAIAAGLDPAAIGPLDDAIALDAVGHLSARDPLRQVAEALHRYGLVNVANAWVEMPLGVGWVAALRLTLQHGTLVVAEIRVFPDEPKRPHLGRWSAEWRGSAAPVPRGGLRMRLLRKLSWGPSIDWTRRVASGFRKTASPEMLATYFGEETIRPQRRKGPRIGRPPVADEFVAKVAKAYVEVLQPGTRPNKAVGSLLGLKASRVATLIFEARRRGFLSPALNKGQAGGSLTSLGKQMAAKAARQQARRQTKSSTPPRRGKRN